MDLSLGILWFCRSAACYMFAIKTSQGSNHIVAYMLNVLCAPQVFVVITLQHREAPFRQHYNIIFCVYVYTL